MGSPRRPQTEESRFALTGSAGCARIVNLHTLPAIRVLHHERARQREDEGDEQNAEAHSISSDRAGLEIWRQMYRCNRYGVPRYPDIPPARPRCARPQPKTPLPSLIVTNATTGGYIDLRRIFVKNLTMFEVSSPDIPTTQITGPVRRVRAPYGVRWISSFDTAFFLQRPEDVDGQAPTMAPTGTRRRSSPVQHVPPVSEDQFASKYQ